MTKTADSSSEPYPKVAVDAILLHGGKLVLVRRANDPFRGRYALPGGFVEFGERLEDAVQREVREETGLAAQVDRVLGVYGDPGRDPRGHTISIAFVLRSIGGKLRAGTDAAGVRLMAPEKSPTLAFDHNRILADFLTEIRLASPTAHAHVRGRTRGGPGVQKPRRTGSNLARP